MSTTLKGPDMLAHFARWRANAIKPNPTIEFGWHQAPAHFGFLKRDGVVTLFPRNRCYDALHPRVRLEIQESTLNAASGRGLVRLIADPAFPNGGVAYLDTTDAARERGFLAVLADLCAFVAEAEAKPI